MEEKKAFLRVALSKKPKLINEPVPITPFFNWDYYYTVRRLIWSSDIDPLIKVDVPGKFVNDLASIPSIFWTILPKTADYTYPAIFHDYLYWFQPPEYDREKADGVLRTVMQELNLPKIKIEAIFKAVRMFGGSSWDSNKTARANGERRILKNVPKSVSVTWDEWKQNPDNFEDWG